MLRLSNYLLIEKNNNGRYIIFSTVTRAVVLLEEREFQRLSLGKTEGLFSENEIEELIRKHILVDKDLNEDNYIDFELHYDRLTTKTFTSFVALSTLCNFSCVYCYEKGQVKKCNRMSHSDIDKLVKWYDERLTAGDYDCCHVELYGGEPLLFFEDLCYFLNLLKKVLDRRSICLKLGMISNGYLLDQEKAAYLANMGLEEIQITIDGIREVHNSRRPLKTGAGTFDQILANIQRNQGMGFTFVIRISFDDTNIQPARELIACLDEYGLHENILLYFAPIHQTIAQQESTYSFCSKAVITDDNTLLHTFAALYSEAQARGYRIPYCYTDGPCMTVSKDSCLIAPDGGLYKCVEMIDEDELCIGNVFEGGYNSRYYDFVSAPVLKECLRKGCIFAPMCGGGCMMQAYMENHNCVTARCNRAFLEKMNRTLLLMNYRDS